MKEISTMGSRIREQRKKMGMTQEELAAKMYTKKVTISAYENDRIDIKCSVVKEMAAIFGCRVGDLLEENNDQVELEYEELIHIFQKFKSQKIKWIALQQLKVLTKVDDL